MSLQLATSVLEQGAGRDTVASEQGRPAGHVPPLQTLLFPFACRFVLRELIETEKMYVEDLGQIVEVCPSAHIEGTDFPYSPGGLAPAFYGICPCSRESVQLVYPAVLLRATGRTEHM